MLFFPARGRPATRTARTAFAGRSSSGDPDLKFAERDASTLTRYLRAHPQVSDVLITGGDPLIMRTSMLARYVEPLLAPELESVRTIRIGTKALAYWPHRCVSDTDADALLALFARVVAAGKQLALMAHYTHPRELSTPTAQAAVRRVAVDRRADLLPGAAHPRGQRRRRRPGPRCGQPSSITAACRTTCSSSATPGRSDYFKVPLVRAHEIFREAYRSLPGLARTVRGPVMSATAGKVVVDGIAELAGERVFCLRFLQAREPAWVGRPFFARFDPDATWLTDLVPASGERSFFFQ